MTEQLHYTIYKITNSVDDKIYIGSTRTKLRKRWSQHKKRCRDIIDWKLYRHMCENGIEKYSISVIRLIIVPSAKHAKIQEQIEMWQYPKEQLLNQHRAHSNNHARSRDIEKKRKARRDFYHRKKQDPEWAEKERVRNKARMRRKRQLARDGVRD